MQKFRRSTNIAFYVVINIIFTLFTYRTIFLGKLFGEPFDSRLQIILHEHWWRWFNGDVNLRNTQFFYPFDKALGYSDVFLTQGIIYSTLRFLTFEVTSSWLITTTALVVIGNIGWSFIAIKYLKNNFLKLFFILTSVSSLSFVNYFTLNPNFVGYAFLSWFALFYLNIKSEKNIDKKNVKVWLFVIALMVYALSCWYAAFFLLAILFTHKIFEIIFLKKIDIDLSIFKIKYFIYFFPIFLFLLGLFIYIYVSVSNQPYRPISEMLGYSPQLKNLLNGGRFQDPNLEGAVFKEIYTSFGLNSTQEYSFGIGIFVSLFFIGFGLFYVLKFKISLVKLIWPLTFISIYFFFLVIYNKSIFSFFYSWMPGINSIRYPNRYIIVLGYFIIFCIFFIIDKLLENGNTKKFWAYLFIIILLLDQSRTPFKGWDKRILINEELQSQASIVKSKCDYFYYDFPGGWWHEQIEGMTFGMLIGVPTINGYSGAFPKNYPTEPFLSQKMPNQILDWLKNIDESQNGCWVTGRTPVRKISNNLNTVDLVGFTNTESDKDNSWNWATSPHPYFYVINFNKTSQKLNFEIKSSKCNSDQIINFEDSDGKILKSVNIYSKSKLVDLDLDFSDSIVKKIDIINKLKPCKIGEDPRNLYFEVKNLNIE